MAEILGSQKEPRFNNSSEMSSVWNWLEILDEKGSRRAHTPTISRNPKRLPEENLRYDFGEMKPLGRVNGASRMNIARLRPYHSGITRMTVGNVVRRVAPARTIGTPSATT